MLDLKHAYSLISEFITDKDTAIQCDSMILNYKKCPVCGDVKGYVFGYDTVIVKYCECNKKHFIQNGQLPYITHNNGKWIF